MPKHALGTSLSGYQLISHPFHVPVSEDKEGSNKVTLQHRIVGGLGIRESSAVPWGWRYLSRASLPNHALFCMTLYDGERSSVFSIVGIKDN